MGMPAADKAMLQRALTETAAATASSSSEEMLKALRAGDNSSAGPSLPNFPRLSFPRLSFGANDDDPNPLAGMGFSDEE
jgi:hypothetical protein